MAPPPIAGLGNAGNTGDIAAAAQGIQKLRPLQLLVLGLIRYSPYFHDGDDMRETLQYVRLTTTGNPIDTDNHPTLYEQVLELNSRSMLRWFVTGLMLRRNIPRFCDNARRLLAALPHISCDDPPTIADVDSLINRASALAPSTTIASPATGTPPASPDSSNRAARRNAKHRVADAPRQTEKRNSNRVVNQLRGTNLDDHNNGITASQHMRPTASSQTSKGETNVSATTVEASDDADEGLFVSPSGWDRALRTTTNIAHEGIDDDDRGLSVSEMGKRKASLSPKRDITAPSKRPKPAGPTPTDTINKTSAAPSEPANQKENTRPEGGDRRLVKKRASSASTSYGGFPARPGFQPAPVTRPPADGPSLSVRLTTCKFCKEEFWVAIKAEEKCDAGTFFAKQSLVSDDILKPGERWQVNSQVKSS